MFFATIMNFVIKFNYKDLLTSIKSHVAGSAIASSRLSHETKFVLGMALLNAISLQMFQNKMKISLTVILVSLVEHLQILKKISFICNDEHIIDNNIYNKGDTGRREMDLE